MLTPAAEAPKVAAAVTPSCERKSRRVGRFDIVASVVRRIEAVYFGRRVTYGPCEVNEVQDAKLRNAKSADAAMRSKARVVSQTLAVDSGLRLVTQLEGS